MVRLFNITKDNRTISCDYEPEKSQQYGYVSISLENQEIVKSRYSDYKYGKNFYLSCTCAKLLQILKDGNTIPTEAFAICH